MPGRSRLAVIVVPAGGGRARVRGISAAGLRAAVWGLPAAAAALSVALVLALGSLERAAQARRAEEARAAALAEEERRLAAETAYVGSVMATLDRRARALAAADAQVRRVLADAGVAVPVDRGEGGGPGAPPAAPGPADAPPGAGEGPGSDAPAASLAGGALAAARAQQEASLASRVLARLDEAVAGAAADAAAAAEALRFWERSSLSTPSIWPASGPVTSGFGWRPSPFGPGSEFHTGIDIAVPVGTPVRATASGVVVRAGWDGLYGYVVEIDHGGGLTTLYGHNQRLLVRPGDRVAKGQVVAASGDTGRSSGPHVHYEVRRRGVPVDPAPFLPQGR